METVRRPKVPERVLQELKFASHMRCSLCQRPGRQVHHINGDPGDNTPENLVLLCFDCHHEVSVKGPAAVRWDPGTVSRHRDEWHRQVAQRRSHGDAIPIPAPKATLDLMLAAVEIHEVTRIGFDLRRADWQRVDELLTLLCDYAQYESWRIPGVAGAILDALDAVVTRGKHEGPVEILAEAHRVASAALPLFSLVGRAVRAPSGDELAVLGQAVSLGHDLSYYGTRYRRSLVLVDAGAELLWEVLRFATLNDLDELTTSALDGFARVLETARHKGAEFPDAVRWLEYRRADALAPNPPYPVMPRDVFEAIHARP